MLTGRKAVDFAVLFIHEFNSCTVSWEKNVPHRWHHVLHLLNFSGTTNCCLGELATSYTTRKYPMWVYTLQAISLSVIKSNFDSK